MPKRLNLTDKQVTYLLENLRVAKIGELNTHDYLVARATHSARFDAETALQRSNDNIKTIQAIVAKLS